jgi:hypothetical protein
MRLAVLMVAALAAACSSQPSSTAGSLPTNANVPEPTLGTSPPAVTARTVEPRPICTKDSFRLQPGWEGATGQSVIWAGLIPTAGASDCRIVERVTFTLVDARTGRLLDLPHNGVASTFTVRLLDENRGAPSVEWWEPYCRSAAVDVVVTDPLGHRAVGHDVLKPRCDPTYEHGTGAGLTPIYR